MNEFFSGNKQKKKSSSFFIYYDCRTSSFIQGIDKALGVELEF